MTTPHRYAIAYHPWFQFKGLSHSSPDSLSMRGHERTEDSSQATTVALRMTQFVLLSRFSKLFQLGLLQRFWKSEPPIHNSFAESDWSLNTLNHVLPCNQLHCRSCTHFRALTNLQFLVSRRLQTPCNLFITPESTNHISNGMYNSGGHKDGYCMYW